MPKADSNQAQVAYARETTWGETPAGIAATLLRITSEGILHEKQTVTSQEVRADRQTVAIVEVGQSAAGDINFELHHSDLELWFENALRSTAIASAVVAQSSTTFAASSITGADGTDYTTFNPGQFVRVDATGNANDNAIVQITAVTSTVLTTTGSTLTVGVASANVHGRTITEGTTKTSFVVETDFTDITGVKYFNGVRVDSTEINVTAQQIVTGVFRCMGKQGFAASTTITSTITSASNSLPMAGSNNSVQIFENDQKLAAAAQSISFTMGNNIRTRPEVGSLYSSEHGDGSWLAEGNMNVYLEDINLLNRFIDHTTSAVAITLYDENNNALVISFPSVKFTTGSPPVAGLNQDVFLDMNFAAFRDATYNYTTRMDFLPAY